ncbi:DUF559 domain-containing protein [Pseudactinotalea sp. HY158]|uniref:DUF559 domain-containing protein n=1 Tax=Pseudactinotalea sp. HY158 TaxID=2654547 RepID=UPI00129C3C21|nr:DUF559 domain-containing protein [Pseudactinotalea sp. HY158]QGH70677.1 DUF559 domain-containing protein [Pseudactinotalea sp. HY158]
MTSTGPPTARRLVAALAARQHGIVARRQVLERGMSKAQIQSRLDTGEWVSIHGGVYGISAAPRTPGSRATAALLYAPAGSALSHLTAARLLDLGVRSGSGAIWISIPHGHRRIPSSGLRFVRSRTLDSFITTMHGWRVTTPARTIVDLATILPPGRLIPVAYDAVRTRVASIEEIARAARAVSARADAPRLRRLLDELDSTFDSGLEVEADHAFRANGLIFEHQYEVFNGDQFVARVDFADPRLKIAIEIDGARYHSSAEAQERDRRRDRRLSELGWHPAHFGTDDVRRRPAEMVAHLRELIAQRAT